MQSSVEKIRIVIADDHKMFREGVQRLLEAEADFEIVGGAGDGAAAVTLSSTLSPDVLLLDVFMPNMDGFEALRRIAAAKLPTRVILLSAALKRSDIVEALKLGIYGAVPKDAGASVLIRAIRCVHSGEYWVEREALASWAKASARDRDQVPEKSTLGLTTRELEIVREIASGLTNHQIAAKIHISEETVKRHLSNIYAKLGLSSRLGLALYAVNHRLTE